MTAIYFIIECAMGRFEEISPAPLFLNVFLAILIASFILKPEKYGYEKIVSGNDGGEQ